MQGVAVVTWGKVDDGLHSHIKWRRTSKGGRALWTTAMSWSGDHGTGGHVPRDMLPYLDGTQAEARSLVSSGLWVVTDDGWQFHQWDERNPDAASQQALVAEQKAGGKFGSHKRWHVKRHLKVPGCEFCDADDTDSG